MKMTKKLILASVVLPLVISANSALAGGKDRDHECRPGLDRGIMHELQLTDAQKQEFKALRKADRAEQKEHRNRKPEQRDEMRENRMAAMNDLLLAEKFDPAKATEMARRMADKHIERQVEMLSKQHKALSILTPEQKAQYIELQQERMEDCGDQRPHREGKGRK
ncbi:CpxP family protein [Marinomonas algarum]|uniref:CpxP family protein n=1 Tax=Marinomonas algarum TaxID=2883105 RepID=A0A9X1INR0_9GAMM|nr:CpxP family protein [Marinomonas algarum]MCB5162214.1 CpxP family protein [Marinomonas algarum]